MASTLTDVVKKGSIDDMQNLTNLSTELNHLLSSTSVDSKNDKINSILEEMLEIVKGVDKRIEVLAKVPFSVSNSKQLSAGETPLALIIRNVQKALTILVDAAFPVILTGVVYDFIRAAEPKSALFFSIIKDEGETSLMDDFTPDDSVIGLDPFATFDEMEEVIWQRALGNEEQEAQFNMLGNGEQEAQIIVLNAHNGAAQKLVFYFQGQKINSKLSIYQAILCEKVKENEKFSAAQLWDQEVYHTLTFRRVPPEGVPNEEEASTPTNTILLLLKRLHAFSVKEVNTLGNQESLLVPSVAHNEFVNKELTEKLEQQMGDSLAVSVKGIPSWWNQLIVSYPFLFHYKTRCKYFKLAAYPPRRNVPLYTAGTMADPNLDLEKDRKKENASRNGILESAEKIMKTYAGKREVILEVQFDDELGVGPGSTIEFYTLVCKEFQNSDLDMWRDISSQYGLFPRSWLLSSNQAIEKFVLLGQVAGRAIQNGRLMNIHFSKAFYKLILGKELCLYDIQSFDPILGRMLLDFHELVNRKKHLESECREDTVMENDLLYRGVKIEDVSLDFSFPGHDDVRFADVPNHTVVNLSNLEDYVSRFTDATVGSGISRQVEAFVQGFNQVFPIIHLRLFSEEELEFILCGEQDSWSWTLNELKEHIELDVGYTASSPPFVHLLEILQEFDHEQRREFVQFMTGSPRLPLGGLASLVPKLTVARKVSTTDLPSVMTCTHHLMLPPYSSKETMKEKLLYAIKEGQGSFPLK